ncbi:MAG: efflux RND transporter periplasmic adaptor subunit [Phenylobacterium sp.]|nr:MAG: efflux RND transporter periplasmic adaptor subunit [Phenylobacterium sp.]
MNRSTLLSQLQIDREPARGGGPRGPLLWPIVLAALAAVVVVGALIWFLAARPDRATVRVAEATSASPGSTTRGGSLLDASGYVVARRAATVSSKITGKVAQVLIEEGQKVAAGQVMARLDDTNARAALDQARAQVAAADSSLRVTQALVEQQGRSNDRNQHLHAKGFLSEQSADDARNAFDNARNNLDLAARQAQVARAGLEMAQRNLDDTVVRAPFTGVVTVKAAQEGEMVSPITAGGGFTRTGIGTLVDMDSLEVEVDVAESFINRVSEGMPAVVKLNAYPDFEIPAAVIAVIPTADRSKATVSVRLALKLKDPRIVPEMGARVSFLGPVAAATAGASRGPRSVVVPADAVQADGPDKGVVFVVADGKLERRAVRLGAQEPRGQVLQAGVAPGEKVVVGGLDKLKDGERVKVTTKGSDED